MVGWREKPGERERYNHLMDVTSQPRATAFLQIRDPMNPFPPQTMIFDTFCDMLCVVWACGDDEMNGRVELPGYHARSPSAATLGNCDEKNGDGDAEQSESNKGEWQEVFI